ncbi:MAG TPA: hypothetical protein DDW85_09740 [Porphyromonadaceae bacterium]|jgi:hypothetical protein|nr:hypothetical protein [Porphyromonadaceae bacterium]
MSNWKVTDKRIYQLLKHPYQVDKSVVEEMTSAYLEFVRSHMDFQTYQDFDKKHPKAKDRDKSEDRFCFYDLSRTEQMKEACL